MEDYAKTLGSIFTYDTQDRAQLMSNFIMNAGGEKSLPKSMIALGLMATPEAAQQGNEGLFLEDRAINMYNSLMIEGGSYGTNTGNTTSEQ